MTVSSFHGLSVPMLRVFGAIFVAVVVFLGYRRNSISRHRSAALRSMGFSQLTREQIFDDPKLLARLIFDRPDASISNWVGRGESALGETVIFDFTYDFNGSSSSKFTVVAFRVAPALADFEISHVLLLERMLHLPNEGDISAPKMGAYDRRTHRWTQPRTAVPVLKRVAFDENPRFAQSFRVWSSDAEALRRVLTRAMIDALVSLNDSNLHVTKRADWLMIYRWVSSATPPARYGALVQDASQLAAHLDLAR